MDYSPYIQKVKIIIDNNSEVTIKREMAAPSGQFLALQGFSVVKETISGNASFRDKGRLFSEIA